MGSRKILGCHNRVDAAGIKVNTVMIDQLLTVSTTRELIDCLPDCGSSNGQRVTSTRKLVMVGLAHLLFFQTPIHLNREWISLAWPQFGILTGFPQQQDSRARLLGCRDIIWMSTNFLGVQSRVMFPSLEHSNEVGFVGNTVSRTQLHISQNIISWQKVLFGPWNSRFVITGFPQGWFGAPLGELILTRLLSSKRKLCVPK